MPEVDVNLVLGPRMSKCSRISDENTNGAMQVLQADMWPKRTCSPLVMLTDMLELMMITIVWVVASCWTGSVFQMRLRIYHPCCLWTRSRKENQLSGFQDSTERNELLLYVALVLTSLILAKPYLMQDHPQTSKELSQLYILLIKHHCP